MEKEVEGLWCLLGGLKGELGCRIFITTKMVSRIQAFSAYYSSFILAL